MAAVRVILKSIGALALAAGGCSFDPGGSVIPDQIPGAGDESVELDCTEWAPAPELVDPCQLGRPSRSLSLFRDGDYLYDTDTSELLAPDGESLGALPSVELEQTHVGMRVLFVDSVEIGPNATLRAEGSRMLVLAAWNEIDIHGAIDVSSRLDRDGAGANSGCGQVGSRNGQPSDPVDKGPGGGAGGSLYALGGAGAVGASDGGDPDGGAPASLFVSALPEIHPGCLGGSGGTGTLTDDAGESGSGGGAVYLAARKTISVDGVINAGGAGGRTGKNWGGGGGGGSGGTIGLSATSIYVSGAIVAHGGGGAGAASHDMPGADGQDAFNSVDRPASGGTVNHDHAGVGGAGGFCDTPAESGTADEDSGGGGGGSVGNVTLAGHAVSQLAPGARVTGHQCQ